MNIDLLPSLLELAGGKAADAVQGRSFLSLLKGGNYREREEIYSEKNYHDMYDPIRCVRTKKHKYIRSFEDRLMTPMPADIQRSQASKPLVEADYAPRPREELYDLERDPAELTNLAEDEAYAEVREELAGKLAAWMEETGDPLLKGPVSPPEGAYVREPTSTAEAIAQRDEAMAKEEEKLRGEGLLH